MSRLRRRRRALSLIEVLISLGLVAVLLTSLFYWYRQVSSQKEIFTQLRGPLMEERYAHQRLQRILPTAALPLFTTLDNTLVFIFDRGPFVHPQLSGKVLGRLYHDKGKQCLCLGVWPYPHKEHTLTSPSQTVVLLDGVSDCSFEFYSPPDLFRKPVDPTMVGKPRPAEGWQTRWSAEYGTLPALIKVIITRDEAAKGIHDHELEYVFDLPVDIFYPQEIA